jgi:raffinose/stachyose/melibiose transport system substrate-binding protein
MKKTTIIILIISIIVIFTSCNNNDNTNSNDKITKITFLNSKGEIQSNLEEAAKLFEKEHPNSKLEIIPCPAGQQPFVKISSLYASGNPPSLSMLDGRDITKFKEKFLDLSKEKWINDCYDNSLNVTKVDNKILAFPFTIEGYGIIYNKNTIEEITKNKFNPDEINTLESFEKLLSKLGDKAIILTPEDWSLSDHYLSLAYSAQSENIDDINKFIEYLKDGKIDLKSNPQLNGLLDNLNLIRKFNIAKSDPLSVEYEKGPQNIGKKDAALWFMGCWAWPQIDSFDDKNSEYGFLPVPISNNAEDYGNTQIPVGPTKFICIDNDKQNDKQKALAKKFLNWFVYEKSGQETLVNKLNIIPAFKNITLPQKNPLNNSINNYMKKNKTMIFVNTLPASHWSELGAAMQKFVDNKMSKEDLISTISEYWKNVKE